MFKHLPLASLLIFLATAAVAQQEPASTDSETLRRRNQADERVYQMALRYNDIEVAKAKLYDLIERNPTNTRYAELLTSIYFEGNMFTSAAISAMDVLEKNDKNIIALEIAAYSLEQLGAFDRALPYFESHYLLTSNLFSLYKTAFMQFSLNRNDEALNSINMLVKNNKSAEQKLGFPKSDESTQEISIKSAAYNLKGMVYMEQKNKEEAKAAFQQALEFDPEFEIAKENLKSAQSM
jgi:tetratricopeptide (TPR) repeat protein